MPEQFPGLILGGPDHVMPGSPGQNSFASRFFSGNHSRSWISSHTSGVAVAVRARTGTPSKYLPERTDLQVGGSEIIAPLGDTMGLIHSKQVYIHIPDPGPEQFGGQAFRRYIEEFEIPINTIVQGDINFMPCSFRNGWQPP